MTDPTTKDIERAYAQADAYLAEALRRGEVFSERTRASTRRLFVAVYAQATANERARNTARLRELAKSCDGYTAPYRHVPTLMKAADALEDDDV